MRGSRDNRKKPDSARAGSDTRRVLRTAPPTLPRDKRGYLVARAHRSQPSLALLRTEIRSSPRSSSSGRRAIRPSSSRKLASPRKRSSGSVRRRGCCELIEDAGSVAEMLGDCLGLLGVCDSPIGGITYRGGEAEGGVQPAEERDARIVAKASQSVASAFRWMVLTVWVLKSSGSVWRGRKPRGESPRWKSQRLVMDLRGKTGGNRRMRFG